MQSPKSRPRVMERLPLPVQEFIWEPPLALAIWPRRLFHMGMGATIPVSALYLPHTLVLWALITLSVLAVLAEAGRTLSPSVNDLLLRFLPFFKPSERHMVTGATFMLLSATFVFVLFEKEIAVLALTFLAMGDPMAALVGIRVHRGRIFGKSLMGTAAFMAAGGAAGLLMTIHPAVPLAWWFVPGLVAAAAAELLPLPLDDNVSVPLAGAGAMQLLAMA